MGKNDDTMEQVETEVEATEVFEEAAPAEEAAADPVEPAADPVEPAADPVEEAAPPAVETDYSMPVDEHFRVTGMIDGIPGAHVSNDNGCLVITPDTAFVAWMGDGGLHRATLHSILDQWIDFTLKA